jgi:hypothetical protein
MKKKRDDEKTTTRGEGGTEPPRRRELIDWKKKNGFTLIMPSVLVCGSRALDAGVRRRREKCFGEYAD